MLNPYFSLLKIGWKYARYERKKYIWIYFMLVCSNIILALNPILFGWFIGKIQRDTRRVLYYAMVYAGCYVCLKLFQWATYGPVRVMERTVAFNMSRNFLQERFHQLLHLQMKWHQDHHSGATINRIRRAYEALRSFFDRGFVYVKTMGSLIFSVSAMLYFSPLFGSIAILLGVCTVFVIRAYDKPFVKAVNEANDREHEFSSTLFDSLSNIMTVITLRLEKSIEAGVLVKVQRIFNPFRRSATITEWKWFSAEMLISLIYGITTVGYIYQHWEPGRVFYVGGLITLLGYVAQFTSVFQELAWNYTDLVEFNVCVQAASTINDSYKEGHRADLPIGLPKDWKEVRLDKLNFSHQEAYSDKRSSQSLHDLHLNIQRGQKIALIGESGSGKSTLLSVLRGLYAPEPGVVVKIDGSIQDLDRLNEAVTLFPQDPEIFENTIAYNITLGLPFKDEDIHEVCRNAHFLEVINELPKGLESDIREKGVNLSGGQKQRLALARGILAARGSDLVLLDEPTSSVDARTEGLIYDDMFIAFADKAVISSVHRLHLLVRFDYIYILQHGRVVDEGSFEYLFNGSAIFQDLWKHQRDPIL